MATGSSRGPRAAFVAVLCLAAAAGEAGATRVPPMELRHLLAESAAVLVARVAANEPTCPDRPPPCSRLTLVEIEALAGGLKARELTFFLPHGRLPDGSELRIAGAPRLRPGERYLLFLRAGDWFNTPVTNWHRSVFREVRLPGDPARSFFLGHDGRPVLGLDERGFRLGEQPLTLPEDSALLADGGAGRGREGTAFSPPATGADRLRAVAEGRIPLEAVAMPGPELLDRVREAARAYGLRDGAAIRTEPAGNASQPAQAAAADEKDGPGLGPAAGETLLPRFRENAPPEADPDPRPEPGMRRQSSPGREIGG